MKDLNSFPRFWLNFRKKQKRNFFCSRFRISKTFGAVKAMATWIQLVLFTVCATIVTSKDILWQRPGCHKVGKFKKPKIYFVKQKGVKFPFDFSTGHSRKIEIPDCVQFSISTNACRGYCDSYAVPSVPFIQNGLKVPKPVTSVGQCCNIMETEDVNVMLSCVGGNRNVTFKSATKCSCYHCKKDWILLKCFCNVHKTTIFIRF